jgi:hypothetical protein
MRNKFLNPILFRRRCTVEEKHKQGGVLKERKEISFKSRAIREVSIYFSHFFRILTQLPSLHLVHYTQSEKCIGVSWDMSFILSSLFHVYFVVVVVVVSCCLYIYRHEKLSESWSHNIRGYKYVSFVLSGVCSAYSRQYQCEVNLTPYA